MKRTLLIGLAVVVFVGLTTGVFLLTRHNQELGVKYAASVVAGDSLRTRFDAALVSIAEIQDSLTAILPSESAVMNVSQDVERGGPLTASRKDQVLRTISDLNESISRSKEMIKRLEEALAARDVQVASMERIVSNLKKTVANREQMIQTLTARVEVLEVQVTTLRADVETGRQQIAEQEQVIENKRREISTIYYLAETKKKLKELGVVRDSGGLIGIGKSTRLSGQFPERFFTRIDTDAQQTLQVAGKKPVVLSAQNTASYQIVPIRPDLAELRITNPEEFRKVRYLVVKVD